MADNRTRNNYLKRTYGITLAEFDKLLESQDYKCAICSRDLRKARIEVDHEHLKNVPIRSTVRGLLCGGRYAGCNRKLGRVDHAPWLKAALKYVVDPPARKVLK